MDLQKRKSDHHCDVDVPVLPTILLSRSLSHCLSLPLTHSLAWHVVWRQEGEGFTSGSLNAIKEQHTDRMRVVNRGKQGRAEDTVTPLTSRPPCITHTRTHTVAHCYLLYTALPMAPHIFKLGPALSSANSCLTPLWPKCVTNRPGDNTFFTPRLSHYLFVWHLISDSLPLFVHLFTLSHLRLAVLFW